MLPNGLESQLVQVTFAALLASVTFGLLAVGLSLVLYTPLGALALRLAKASLGYLAVMSATLAGVVGLMRGVNPEYSPYLALATTGFGFVAALVVAAHVFSRGRSAKVCPFCKGRGYHKPSGLFVSARRICAPCGGTGMYEV